MLSGFLIYNASSKKKWGQNFLIDSNIINKIVDTIEPSDKDTIIEKKRHARRTAKSS